MKSRLLRAESLEQQGRFREARAEYEQLLGAGASKKGGLHLVEEYWLTLGISRCLLRLADYGGSLEYSYRSLALAKELGKYDVKALAFIRVAAVYAGLNDLEMALEYAHLAWKAVVRAEWDNTKAQAAVSLAAVYLLMDDYTRAFKYANLLQEHRRYINDNESLIRSALYIGMAELGNGRLQKSEAWSRLALKESSKANYPFYIAKSYHALGWVALKSAQYDIANGHFTNAANIFFEIGEIGSANSCLECLSRSLEEQGRYHEALDALKTAYNYSNALQAKQRETIRAETSAGKTHIRQRLLTQSPDLTVAEMRICEMIAQGFDTKQISGTLAISHRTVERHRANIRKKLRLRGKATLAKVLLEIQ